MSSNIKMFYAKHYTKGVVSAEDVELDLSFRDNLTCVDCGVPLSFVRSHMRKKSYVLHHFKLYTGMKTHRLINGEKCNFEASNLMKIKLPTSKTHNVVAAKDLKIRINIPVHLEKTIMHLLTRDLIPKTDHNKSKTKKSPGTYEKADYSLSDYINSATALSKIAREWEKNKEINYIEFTFHGLTARWMDIYYENWDKLYNKFTSRFPKALIIMRGIVSNIKQTPYIDNQGFSWVELYLKKTPISELSSEAPKTFSKIILYQPLLDPLIRDLRELKRQGKRVEIIFFGLIERPEKRNNDYQNVIGIAAYRKQLHYQIIK